MKNAINPPAAAHGIRSTHRVLIARIQDLALDINALPGRAVFVHFYGNASQIDVRIFKGDWQQIENRTHRWDISLPRPDRLDAMSDEALNKLGDVVNAMEVILKEATQ